MRINGMGSVLVRQPDNSPKNSIDQGRCWQRVGRHKDARWPDSDGHLLSRRRTGASIRVKMQLTRFERWVRDCKPLLIPYDEICFNTCGTLSRIAAHLGVSVDIESIADRFTEDKSAIGQF